MKTRITTWKALVKSHLDEYQVDMAHIDPLSAVAQLQQVVLSLAPVLRPQVLPKGAGYGLDLVLSLCKTAEQKQQLRALVQSSKPTASGDDDDELEPQAVGAFDVERKLFNVEKVVWMKPQDVAVHEFARFLELQLADPDEVRGASRRAASDWMPKCPLCVRLMR